MMTFSFTFCVLLRPQNNEVYIWITNTCVAFSPSPKNSTSISRYVHLYVYACYIYKLHFKPRRVPVCSILLCFLVMLVLLFDPLFQPECLLSPRAPRPSPPRPSSLVCSPRPSSRRRKIPTFVLPELLLSHRCLFLQPYLRRKTVPTIPTGEILRTTCTCATARLFESVQCLDTSRIGVASECVFQTRNSRR